MASLHSPDRELVEARRLARSLRARLDLVERVLDHLPVAVARFDLPVPIPTRTAPTEAAERIHREARVGYVNLAGAKLSASTPEDLLGVPLSDPAFNCMPDAAGRARFWREGFLFLDPDPHRRIFGGREQVLRCTWLGVVEHDAVSVIWAIAENVTTEHTLLERLAAAEATDEDEIVGRSAAILEVQRKVAQVAPTDATVLILGETGTGKELVARAIHAGSPRRHRPLIAVNCGAIATGLVESELFGHEKGAFTGALARKIGRFELADGGTLFLDEIGDLSPELQVKLLRVLQEGEIARVGGTEPIKVDVRIVAATHRDLPALVRSGTFRQDLYYRLNVFPLRTPPLRQRIEDVPLLASWFAQRYAARLGKRIERIPPDVLAILQAHPWPGNIRELANIIERSVIVTDGPELRLAEWVTGQFTPVTASSVPVPGPTPGKSLRDMEREHILRTLERTGWKVSGPGGAAEALNLKPTTLEARMKKLGIQRPR